ncbi:MAG: copper homeostasis protein CutC [Gemmatimonadaceae bacterium]
MSPHILIEAAVDSIASADQAVAEGADRLEACGNLGVGGLTPSFTLLRHCLTLGVPCLAMVRPRAGDFFYGPSEIADIHAVASELCDAGADGVVVGILRRDGSVDAHATRGIVEVAGAKATVFHRAFDATPNASAALDALVKCGVTRVLTAGQASSAVEGADALAKLRSHAAGRIEILAGGGVRATNVAELVRRSGVLQVHARATEPGVVAAIRAALAPA